MTTHRSAFDVKIGDRILKDDGMPVEVINIGRGMLRGHLLFDLADGTWSSNWHGDLIELAN